jgi:hypothetical protein
VATIGGLLGTANITRAAPASMAIAAVPATRILSRDAFMVR